MKKTKFVVFTLGRTGSTLLEELLLNIPNFVRLGEKLSNPDLCLKDLPSLIEETSEDDVVCLKLKRSHLGNSQIEDDRRDLKLLQENSWKLIHLTRTNLLFTAVSFLYARERNKFFSYKFERFRREERLVLDAEEVIEITKGNIRSQEADLDLMEGFEHLSINYETDLEDSRNHEDTIRRICEYTGCGPARSPLNINVKKSVPHPSKRIRNWKDIVEAARKHGLESFL